jgi:hypothetical protein
MPIKSQVIISQLWLAEELPAFAFKKPQKRSFTAGPRSVTVNKSPKVRLRFNMISLLKGVDGQHMPTDNLVHNTATSGTRESEHLQ